MTRPQQYDCEGAVGGRRALDEGPLYSPWGAKCAHVVAVGNELGAEDIHPRRSTSIVHKTTLRVRVPVSVENVSIRRYSKCLL